MPPSKKEPQPDKINGTKDVGVPLAVAIIALPVGMKIESYKSNQAEAATQCERSAAYLDEMAISLEAMIKDFNSGIEPRESGVEFKQTMDLFGNAGEKAVGSDTW